MTAQQGFDLLGLLIIAGVMHALVLGMVCTAVGCVRGGLFRRRVNS